MNDFKIFQFQYGAIEGRSDYSTKLYEVDFNSSMVRLKVRQELCEDVRCQFQFQYGAIEGSHGSPP